MKVIHFLLQFGKGKLGFITRPTSPHYQHQVPYLFRQPSTVYSSRHTLQVDSSFTRNARKSIINAKHTGIISGHSNTNTKALKQSTPMLFSGSLSSSQKNYQNGYLHHHRTFSTNSGYKKASEYAYRTVKFIASSVLSGYITYMFLKPVVEKDEKEKEDERRTKYRNMHMNSIEIKIKTPKGHVERGNVLKTLRKEVRDASKNNSDGIITILVAGNSGTGKSVFAIDYAKDWHKKRHSEELATEWIIGAENERETIRNYLSFAKNELQIDTNGKTLKTVIYEVNDELKKRPAWVLIFDNVDKYSSIEEYLPKSPQIGGGQILVTSKENMSDFPKKCIKIDLNADDNKISLVQTRKMFLTLNDNDKRYENSSAHIDAVVVKLKGSITAIKTFALFVNSKPKDNTFNFEQECESIISDLEGKNANQSVDDVLYKRIFGYVSEESRMLLSVSKFFYPDRISEKMLSQAFEQVKEQKHQRNFLAVYNELIGFGLIEEVEDGNESKILKIHRSLNKYLFDDQSTRVTSEDLLKVTKKLHGSNVFDAKNEEKNGLFYLHFSGILDDKYDGFLSPIVIAEIATMVGGSYEYIGWWDHSSMERWIKDLKKTISYIENLKSQDDQKANIPRLNLLLAENYKCLSKAHFFYLKSNFDLAEIQLNQAITSLNVATVGVPGSNNNVLKQILERNRVSALLEKVIAEESTNIEVDLNTVISGYKERLKYKCNDNTTDEKNTIICKDRLARAYIEKAKRESSSVNRKKYLDHALYHLTGENKELIDQDDQNVADGLCVLDAHKKLADKKEPYIREDENYVTLAMIHLESKRFDAARNALEMAIKKNKHKRDIVEGDIHYYMSVLDYNQCKYTSCDKEIRVCIDIFENLYMAGSIHLKNAQTLQKKNDCFVLPQKLIAKFKN